MSSDNTAQTHLQQTLSRQLLALLAGPRHGVDHVADIVGSGECVVEFSQVLGGLGLPADLEELDADLPRLGVVRVEFLGGADDHALDVVAGHAVGDDNDVQGLDGRGLALGLCGYGCGNLGEVRAQDVCQTRAGRGTPERSHRLEEVLHRCRGGDVGVAAVGGVRVAVVEEVDVNAVRVVGCTDRGDGCECCRCFSPASSRHAAAVIDEEDGIELAEKCVWRVLTDLHWRR